MFSVVTPRIWVSPRWNSAEPCTRGSTPTSADRVRMSASPRPSIRMFSVSVRCRTIFLVSALSAPEISFSRPSKRSASFSVTSWRIAWVASLRSSLPGICMACFTRSAASASTAAYTSSA